MAETNTEAENIDFFLQQGVTASDAGDYTKAAEWYSKAAEWHGKAAEQGDATAQYKLGVLYLGHRYHVMGGIPTTYPKWLICLFGTLGEKPPDYSLWNVEFQDDGSFKF